jgi:hypothetical protein
MQQAIKASPRPFRRFIGDSQEAFVQEMGSMARHHRKLRRMVWYYVSKAQSGPLCYHSGAILRPNCADYQAPSIAIRGTMIFAS